MSKLEVSVGCLIHDDDNRSHRVYYFNFEFLNPPFISFNLNHLEKYKMNKYYLYYETIRRTEVSTLRYLYKLLVV